MACYHPSTVRVDRLDGPRAGRDSVQVGCGNCLGCRKDESRDWAVRLAHEQAMHPLSSYFVTLTYNDEHLPGYWPDDDREFGSLDPAETTDFLKRLRRRVGDRIRYFYCGEYGGRSDRPHYHFAMFGASFLDRDQVGERHGSPVFHSDMLRSSWPFGNHEITTLNFGACAYVAGYVNKKIASPFDGHRYERVDQETGEVIGLVPEFRQMSRRPGLGRAFLEKYWRDIYPRDEIVLDGKKFRPPRYYDKVMERIAPEVIEEVKFKRFQDAPSFDDEQLERKEIVHKARLETFGTGRINV